MKRTHSIFFDLLISNSSSISSEAVSKLVEIIKGTTSIAKSSLEKSKKSTDLSAKAELNQILTLM